MNRVFSVSRNSDGIKWGSTFLFEETWANNRGCKKVVEATWSIGFGRDVISSFHNSVGLVAKNLQAWNYNRRKKNNRELKSLKKELHDLFKSLVVDSDVWEKAFAFLSEFVGPGSKSSVAGCFTAASLINCSTSVSLADSGVVVPLSDRVAANSLSLLSAAWKPPICGFKINVDATLDFASNAFGVGLVVRDIFRVVVCVVALFLLHNCAVGLFLLGLIVLSNGLCFTMF
ncbi:hypothetical protein ACOSP7_023948 [Xanthoceras sorbifolium]